VRRRTRLHADKAPRQSLEEAQNLNTAHRLADYHGAARIDAMDLKTFMARSIPIVVISLMDGSRRW
jgi:hypothetical protein